MISAVIAGNITRDAESGTTPNAQKVLNFTVACNRFDPKDKDAATFVRVAVWGERGQKLAQYLTKGSSVVVRGELYTREYEKDGQKRTAVEMRADDVKLMGGKRDEAKPAARQSGDPDWLHG